MSNLEREMKEESEDKKKTLSIAVSEKWREKHEGRMKTVGVVRTQREDEKEKEEEKEETLAGLRDEEERKPTSLPTLDKVNELGNGWEWS